MLSVKNLSLQFEDFKAVDDVSFNVNCGEIFGLLGANGAGKTTTIRMICGLLVPDNGELVIASEDEKNITTISKETFDSDDQVLNVIKKRIGYMSQKFTLYDDLTVEENWQFTCKLRSLSKEYLLIRKQELSNWISIEKKYLSTFVKDLPNGIKQKVALTSALFHDPELILLDEPTAGVSPVARKEFWDLINDLAKLGKMIIVTTHYMDEAENCHNLALMRAGKIIEMDSPKNIIKKTFPNGIYQTNCRTNLMKQLEEKKIISLWPCGINYHFIIRNVEQFKFEMNNEIINKNFSLSSLQQIDASLEDVFIELVEGINR